MKKTILTLAIMIAAIGSSFANEMKVDSLLDVAKIEAKKDTVKALPNVISFYDVERIQIKNEKKHLIKIYDSNWNLINETKDNVDLKVIPGNYYIACDGKIKGRYVSL